MKENRSHRLLILFVGIIFLFNGSLSASLKFDHFSNKEGFNQNTIVAIDQDKYGNLWFATPNGLIKYDGYEFYNYNSDGEGANSVTDNHIECLLADKNGNLWIGHWKGVDVYLPEFEKFIAINTGSEFIANNIKEDSNGNLWITGGNTFFVCQLNHSGSDFLFDISDNLTETNPNLSQISDFCFIDDSNILFSKEKGLFRLEFEISSIDKKPIIKSIHNFSSLADKQILAIKKINNIFWIGTDSGLYKTILDGEQLRIIEKFSLITSNNRLVSDLEVLSIFEDINGSIWIGSGDEGIFKYDPDKNSFENYGFDPKNQNGISSSRINCFFQDNFNVLWIGTAQGGVNKLDLNQKQFINYSNNPYDKNSIAGNLIMDILEDNEGILWISSYDGEVSRSTKPVNEGNVGELRFEQLKNKMPLKKQEIINSLFQDSKGYIWMGGEDSPLVVYNPVSNQFKKVLIKNKGVLLNLSRCRTIGQLDSTNILIGGERVFVLHNPWDEIKNNKNPLFELDPVLNELSLINSLLKDRHGNFWIGTEGALYHYEYIKNEFNILGTYSTFSTMLKLSHNNIFTLHEDSSGNIWAGTYGGGINKISINTNGRPFNIEYVTKKDQLPNDAVYGILQQDDEHLWISTDKGLCRLNIVNNKIDLFGMSDGLPQNNFRQSAYFKGKSGYYYFGGLNGLTVFKPENIKLNDVLPKPMITGISINNKQLKIGEELDEKVLLEKSSIETERIELNHRAKIVTFRLAVQHYTAPLKNKLAYMLEGFNNEWIVMDEGKSSVTFTNLLHGNYVLHVKGANGDGFWTQETTDLNVKILPPWYKTWWSYTIGILIIVAITVGVFLYFMLHEKLKQRLKYEQIDKQRIDNINEGRLQFFTNISHEFRTPLTLIVGPLEKVIEKNKDKENSKYLNTIQKNTKRLMSLVDQLITFRKAEQGHLSLNLSKNTLGNFIFPTTEAFEEFAIQKHINFYYKINSPNEEVVIDVVNTERIIFNLLSNSFRHTPVNGNISIETDIVFVEGKKIISIRVIDTGKGIPNEKQHRIFERFYQIEGRKENVGGTGIGLAFCKSIIDLMGGTISVESEPNIRTCFTALIPSKSIDENSQEIIDSQSYIKDWVPIQSSEKEVVSGVASNNTKKHTLLIVDDEADVREFLMKELGGGYSIVMAENGSVGWKRIHEYEPDLIISDVMMPDMNGFELCEKIKSSPETCHLPVILLTALGDNENRIKGFEFRADDYISKPFSPRHLELRIEKLIENNQRLKEHFSTHSSIPDNTIEISTRDKNFLTQISDAIEANLADSSFGVEELANEIGLSPSQFYRRLKQLTGQVPNAYLRNFRLQKAAELLKSNEGFSVAEVMYQIGIESSSYFSTSFKKKYRVTPSDYISVKKP